MSPDFVTPALVIGLVISLYVMAPILTLVHELGHAVAVIRAGKRPVVVVGKSPPIVAHRFKSFDLRFHPRLAIDYFYPMTKPSQIPKTYLGECRWDPAGVTVAQARSALSAGPHASIIAGLCLGILAWFASPGSVLYWTAAISAVGAITDGLGNLVPTRKEGRLFSDGAKMELIRGLPDDMVVPGPRPAPSPSTEAGRAP